MKKDIETTAIVNNPLTRARNNQPTNDLSDNYLRCCSCISLSNSGSLETDYDNWSYSHQMEYLKTEKIPEDILISLITDRYPHIGQISIVNDRIKILDQEDEGLVWGVPTSHRYFHNGDMVRYALGQTVLDKPVVDTMYRLDDLYVVVKNTPISNYGASCQYVNLNANLISKLFENNLAVTE